MAHAQYKKKKKLTRNVVTRYCYGIIPRASLYVRIVLLQELKRFPIQIQCVLVNVCKRLSNTATYSPTSNIKRTQHEHGQTHNITCGNETMKEFESMLSRDQGRGQQQTPADSNTNTDEKNYSCFRSASSGAPLTIGFNKHL